MKCRICDKEWITRDDRNDYLEITHYCSKEHYYQGKKEKYCNKSEDGYHWNREIK